MKSVRYAICAMFNGYVCSKLFMDPEDGLTLSPASLEADHCDQAVSPSQVSCDWLPEVT